jgi:hypothetical protein
MTPDIASLRAKAEAATPGPWQIGGVLQEIIDGDVAPTNLAVVYSRHRATTITGECWDGDAIYIAAMSPDQCIALLDRIAELEGEVGEMAVAGATAYSLQNKRLTATLTRTTEPVPCTICGFHHLPTDPHGDAALVRARRGNEVLITHWCATHLRPKPCALCSMEQNYANLQEKYVEMRSFLENYGQHHGWCDSRGQSKSFRQCNCGLAAALAGHEGRG